MDDELNNLNMTWISKKKKIERKKKNIPSATFFSYVMNIFQKASVFADSLSIPWIVDIQQSTLRHSKPCRRSENWPLDYFQTVQIFFFKISKFVLNSIVKHRNCGGRGGGVDWVIYHLYVRTNCELIGQSLILLGSVSLFLTLS